MGKIGVAGDLVQTLGDVGAVDDDPFFVEFGTEERNLVQQPLHHRG